LIDESEVTEAVWVDNKKVNKRIGYNLNYVCKERGCGITVFVPEDEYEEYKKNMKMKK